MQNIGRNFILLGLIWLICGMAYGIWMGITQHLNFANSHAHANLVGFVTSVLFGLIHQAYPQLRQSRLAIPQFVIYEIGALLLVLGKAMVDNGGSDTLVKVGALVVIIGAVLMPIMFVRHSQSVRA
jgi:hypothetical protein